jgi:hypothetical protein
LDGVGTARLSIWIIGEERMVARADLDRVAPHARTRWFTRMMLI